MISRIPSETTPCEAAMRDEEQEPVRQDGAEREERDDDGGRRGKR